MAKNNTSIPLDEPYVEFAQRKVAAGQFGSIIDVVHEAMRRYVAEDTKLEALRREIQKGLDSGVVDDFDFDRFIEETFGAE